MSDNLGNTVTVESPSLPKLHINDLPQEVLIEIFSNLELIQLPQIQLVCKEWCRIISDPMIWEKLFNGKFGAGDNFPSWSGSSRWVVEYIARSSGLKKWKKAHSEHINYQILNEFVDNITLVNFSSDKLMVYSRIGNSVNICGLRTGRNQTFVPGDNNHVIVADVNWNYLVFSTNDRVYVKSLAGATAGSSRSSTKELIAINDVVKVRLREVCDKFKDKPDIIICNTLEVIILNLLGTIIKQLPMQNIIDFGSDFKYIIVVTSSNIEVLSMENDYTLKSIDYQGDVEIQQIQQIDYDYDDSNIIIHQYNRATVINYETGKVSKIDFNQAFKFGKLQASRGKRNKLLAGKDGLYYATVLHDNTVVVWSVRDNCKKVCKFKTEFKYKNLGIRDVDDINCIELNSGVIIAGGYNGFANVHDLFTGNFLRECSIKFPKKYDHMYSYRVPVREIKVNGNYSNGIIICGDLIQYFQFGEDINKAANNSGKKKKFVSENNYKKNHKKIIKDQLEDYELNEFNQQQIDKIMDKYNGEDEDDINLAIALSRSTLNGHDTDDQALAHINDQDEDEELRKAIELSKLTDIDQPPSDLNQPLFDNSIDEQPNHSHTVDDEVLDDDEALKRAIELSLLEQ